MKIKQHVMISRPENFRHGNYSTCFSLLAPNAAKRMCDEYGYIDCSEIEIEINVSGDEIVASMVKTIDAQIKKELGEHEVKMNLLRDRKNELLAITHEGES